MKQDQWPALNHKVISHKIIKLLTLQSGDISYVPELWPYIEE